VAPLSWLVVRGVAEGAGRQLSEWSSYSPSQRQTLLARHATTHRQQNAGTVDAAAPETQASSRDIETICAAAQQTPARAAGGSQ
jgi:predicted Fe-S protein YdhL (DUF1289 family)